MPEDYNENLAREIQEEEQLDISIERVEKIPSPLLVIGLGGTGASIVHTIKKTFAQRFELPRDEKGNLIPIPRQTAYLEIDTDHKSKGSLADDEYVDISVEGIDAILDPKKRDYNLQDYERQWVNKQLNASSSGMGAGTYRQSARFQLSRKYNKVEAAIQTALTKVTRVAHGNAGLRGRVEIVIATGICGGTGSGTFLDIPQIVRKCMEEGSLAGQDYRITGYIVMPDVSLSVPSIQNDPALTRQLSMNGYAALKELDFWQNIAVHETSFTANLNGTKIVWKRAPYDACVLMSSKTVDGTLFSKGDDVVQNTIAENLLHYLANEAPSASSNGQATYTYISHENNLVAAVNNMKKRLPLHYGYRAIGAYTKRIPKKKVLYYEGSLLFNTFMPLKDDHGNLVPNAELLQDGNTLKRAQQIVGDVGTLHNNFRTQITLPGFCRTPSNDKPHLDAMRNMQVRPHDQADIKPSLWQSTVVRPAARKTADAYLEAAWGRFCSFSKWVITNPKFGPFTLREYMTSPSAGIMRELDAQLVGWNAYAARFNSDLHNRYEACVTSWNDFFKPPLLGAKAAIEKYLGALNDYYGSVVKIAFMEEHARALSLLVQRVHEYVDRALKPMCDDLAQMSDDFAATDVTDSKLESDLFALETVQKQIDTDFNDKNEENRVTLEFLSAVCDESLKNAPSVDAHSTGMVFTYGIRRRANLLDVLKNELDVCFHEINGQSLDSIMEQAVGNDVAAQNKYMDELGASVIDSSRPMFSQDAAVANEECIKYNYLSIPQDSTKFIQHYQNKTGIDCKESSLQDHVYCVTSWDGLPLYRYGLIGKLEEVYCDSLQQSNVCMGAHLVWDGDLDSNYITNWTKLPAPAPYYFFKAHGTPFSEKQYADVHALAERAIDAGMLEVDTSNPVPVYHVHAFYADAQHEVVLPGRNIAEKANEIIALTRNPSTGSNYTPDDKLKMLRELLASATRETIQPGQRPDCLATYMGLQNEPVDPTDPDIRVDAMKLSKAQENYKKLSRELASVVVSSRPRLALTLSQQVDGFEAVQKIISSIEGQANAWQPRIEYADTFGKMFIHSLIQPSMAGGFYRNDMGEKTQIIQGDPSEDIVALHPMIKLPAYLADVGPQNEMRRYLEFMLDQKENEIAEKEKMDELTKEDVQKLLDRVDALDEFVTDAMKQKKSELVKMGADTATINKCIALLKNLQDLCSTRKKMYKMAMPI